MSRLRTVLSFVFAITILSQCSPLWAENAVPVVIWGDSTTSNFETTAVNPFVKTTFNGYTDILMSLLKNRPPVLGIVSENLCVEDIVQHKQQFQQAIHKTNYKYMPLVEQASYAFQELTMYNQTDDVDVETISDGQLLIRPIDNLDSLSEVLSEINIPKLVVVVTGKGCSYRKSERIRRQATEDSMEIIVPTKRVLFYASGPLQLKTANDTEELPKATSASNHGDGTPESPLVLHTTFNSKNGKVELSFSFEVKSPGYFTLATVEYGLGLKKSLLNATSNMVFPFKFSYHCSQKTTFKGDDIELTISDLQVEVDAEENTFSDAYDCVGFTTIPIWTGLFVTAILAAIMIWGLSMIIDIRTMDRFDDPKGKTITISAQE